MAAYSGAPDAVDFSYSRISGATLASKGIKLACRYLSHTDGKNLHASEAQDLLSHGVGILLNWESSANRALGGSGSGTPDGRDAASLAESVGAPHGKVIYYSVDENVSPDQYYLVEQYLIAAREATSGRYGVGVYAKYGLIQYLNSRGFTHNWQTYAWSGGLLSTATDLYQYLNGQTLAGGSVDYDHIIHAAELGAWWPEGHDPSGGGSPLAVEDITLDAETKTYLDAKFSDIHDSFVLVLHGDAGHVDSLDNILAVGQGLTNTLNAVAGNVANARAEQIGVDDVKSAVTAALSGASINVDPTALGQVVAQVISTTLPKAVVQALLDTLQKGVA
jgi:hypothetical protein